MTEIAQEFRKMQNTKNSCAFFCLSDVFRVRTVFQQRVKLRETKCVYDTKGPGRGRAG